jgi:murein DD-endopeptidase MepM/ murein hydrolase activator NlpD
MSSPWPWLVGGSALALAAYWWESDRDESPAPAGPLPGAWVVPLARWRGRAPEVSDGFASSRRDARGKVIKHGGLDFMYPRRSEDAATMPIRTPHGSTHYVMPDDVPARAASDGVVWFAAQTPRGWTVVIDHHPGKLATYYTHMSRLLVSSRQRIEVGQPLGIVGADPLDREGLMHLHFETWRGAASTRFDPSALMAAWRVLPEGAEHA